MASGSAAAALLRAARARAKLTQRALARRAGTTQAVVARIESGRTSPGWDTLQRLLRASGFDLRAEIVPRPLVRSHMMQDVARILRLSAEDRLREVAAVSRFVANTRRV
jgi:transcriptional regulator with XRE-family HTH domain